MIMREVEYECIELFDWKRRYLELTRPESWYKLVVVLEFSEILGNEILVSEFYFFLASYFTVAHIESYFWVIILKLFQYNKNIIQYMI